MPEVTMPRLSDSMEEGTVVRWLAEDGAEVTRGQEIVEVETDKATMGYEADAAGRLRHVVGEGETVAVGALIATIGDAAPPAAVVPEPSAPAAVPSVPDARPGPSVTADRGPGASPVARRFAAAHGIALADVRGSGRNGRIVKADVRAHAESAPATPARVEPVPRTQTGPEPGPMGVVTVTEPSRIQRVVARRMVEGTAGVPDFSVSVDVDVTELLALRARLKAREDPAPSVNDLLVKLTAFTLRRHPKVNGAYRDERFETFERVNVGIAVATEDGLVVPTIVDADRRPLGDVAADARRLAGAVRDGTITPAEVSGATFTVSNLGMFGVDRFTGLINPPQAAILCVGAITVRPGIAEDGSVAARPQMELTLVSDHRILYGADAARFLAELRDAVADPLFSLL